MKSLSLLFKLQQIDSHFASLNKTSKELKIAFAKQLKLEKMQKGKLISLQNDQDEKEIELEKLEKTYGQGTIMKLSDENIVKILNEFELERNIEKLSKSNLLIPLVDIFLQCDLSPEKISDNHMEFIFEGLLFFSSSSTGGRGNSQHYTPRDIVELLVSFIFSNELTQLGFSGQVASV